MKNFKHYLIVLAIFIVVFPILIAWATGPFLLVWCKGISFIIDAKLCHPLWP